MNRVFVDANIIIDVVNATRSNHKNSLKKVSSLLSNNHRLFTSCDIFTTVYYVASKSVDCDLLIKALDSMLEVMEIIPIDSAIIKKALHICSSEKNSNFEDVLQYVCAKTFDCDLILTNDHDFYSPDIRLMGCE